MELSKEVPKKKRRLGNDNMGKNSNDNIVDINSLKSSEKKNPKNLPKFRLKKLGETASLETTESDRIPITLTDVQHLLLHSLLGNVNLSESPRWYVIDKCDKVRNTCCLVLEGISINHWNMYAEHLTGLRKIFNNVVEILTPSVYDGSLVQELALVPLSEVDKESIIQKYGSMNLALEARKDLMIMMRAVFPISGEKGHEDIPIGDKFPRTQLIMSAWQLIEEGYPLPLKGKYEKVYSDYLMTKDEYKAVTPESPLFALDCEMCMTNAGSELTRISIVNEKHEVVYQSFVKPYNNIKDYLTRYSGVTKESLENITKRLEDVQNDIRELLPADAILVGQSLNLDLHALKMMHPYIIDTSLIYNFTGERTRKPKLQTLAREFLNQKIQVGKNGHCPIEDSIASLKLVQLKLSKNIEFGDAVHEKRQKYKENYCTTQEYAFSIFNHMIEQKITSLIVGCDDITGDYHTYLTKAKESMTNNLKKVKPKRLKLNTLDSQEEVISSLSESVNEYNFSMAHLKLEMNADQVEDQVQKVNRWIETVWKSVPYAGLCVILFGGLSKDNGVALIKVKDS